MSVFYFIMLAYSATIMTFVAMGMVYKKIQDGFSAIEYVIAPAVLIAVALLFVELLKLF